MHQSAQHLPDFFYLFQFMHHIDFQTSGFAHFPSAVYQLSDENLLFLFTYKTGR